MQFEARVEPLEGKLPKAVFRWDPETDILSVICPASGGGQGMTGTVDLEGGDGAFVVVDVADGTFRGLDVVNWPDDVPSVAGLAPPATSETGRLRLPARRSQPGVAAVEVDTALVIEKNPAESVFHIRVGRARAARPVRIAQQVVIEIDRQNRVAGFWLVEVPPFPNVESGA